MKYLKILIAAAVMLVTTTAFGQNLTVTGTVTDSSNGLGVPYAGVQIKDTTTGTVTDENGLYSITAPSDAVLVFSSIGYKDVEMPVGGKTQIDITLSPDTETIDHRCSLRYSDQGVVHRFRNRCKIR